MSGKTYLTGISYDRVLWKIKKSILIKRGSWGTIKNENAQKIVRRAHFFVHRIICMRDVLMKNQISDPRGDHFRLTSETPKIRSEIN